MRSCRWSVEQLKQQKGDAHRVHPTVIRAWGSYTVLEEGLGYKIKKIMVNPGAKLSLQMHHQRSEHWVVVEGIATVTCGESVYTIQSNQSTFAQWVSNTVWKMLQISRFGWLRYRAVVIWEKMTSSDLKMITDASRSSKQT